MANKEYLKSLEIGEWLAIIFNKDIKSWEYLEAFKKAKEILNFKMHFQSTAEYEEVLQKYGNLTVDTLRYISENKLEDEYIKLAMFDDDTLLKYEIEKNALGGSPFFFQGKDPLMLGDYISKRISVTIKELYGEKLKDIKEKLHGYDIKGTTGQVMFQVYPFLYSKHDAYSWLKNTINEDAPLGYRFGSLNGFNVFMDSYNSIQSRLEYDPTNSRFVQDLFYEGIQYGEEGFMFDNPNVLFSRLFLDFLFLGGLDYYGFCGHCDKFIVIQRKGRKKYCTDNCRALAHKEKKSH